MKLSTKIISVLFLLIFISSFTNNHSRCIIGKAIFFDTIKKNTTFKDSTLQDSSQVVLESFKKNVHASYYHDKFNGRRTASGEKFNNNLYTAAHRKLKFGTKVKVTNTVNDKSVIVVINDRGPFVKGREIDLSKKAFMEIAKNKNRGYLDVNIEIVKE
ncbi:MULTISPECIES: septal ring lytic transglycosylase RlpA family protein [Flavobacterium]|uniref:Probable endolytic peptidoglycan transglycosylase RlpA n=1 Tax=Flavobacterium jumunjinense TaxID=998845 RepID=A0ABV5GIM3_9FLAO|nr:MULTISPECIES: septal ring lytic transglycosylase RlpA family protein [Flavobacterium]